VAGRTVGRLDPPVMAAAGLLDDGDILRRALGLDHVPLKHC
jgi:hypothetical protein